MRSAFSQYGKVVILIIVMIPILGFWLGGGFQSKMPKDDHLQTHVTGKEDNEVILDDISARKKPVITITKKKFKNGEEVQFLNYAKATYQDANATSQKIWVKEVTDSAGVVTKSPITTIKVKRGLYTVRYHAEEKYRGALIYSEKTAKFLVN